MTTVRKETEKLPDGNELVLEVIEDKPDSHRVSITLMSKGAQGEIALGRANLGQVFRRQSRDQAESLVDAVQNYLTRDAEVAAAAPLEAQIRAKAEGKTAPSHLPTPVKERGLTGRATAGIELDHHTRRDFAAQLRALADEVETGSPKLVITALDIAPVRGGGQTIGFTAIRKS